MRARRRYKITKVFADVLFGLVMVAMVIAVFSLVEGRRTGQPPRFLGYQSYIVLTGSMGPTFNAGSMIFIKPVDVDTLKVGDIVTFKAPSDDVSTTHRIVDIISDGQLMFVTKGDANEENDHTPVRASEVLGKVTLAIPYMGYVMDFARTRTGLLILVVAPAGAIMVSELRKLYQYAVELDRDAEDKKRQQEAEQAST